MAGGWWSATVTSPRAGGGACGRVRRWQLLLAGAIVIAAIICGAVIGREAAGNGKKDAVAPSPAVSSSATSTMSVVDDGADKKKPAAAGAVVLPDGSPAAVTPPKGDGAASNAPPAAGSKLPSLPSTLGGQLATQDTDKAEGDMERTGGDGSTCIAESGDDIHAAAADETCSVILLLSNALNAYTLTEEVLINRPVVVTGNPLTLPLINATASERAFHVRAGGFLDLRYVRVTRGKGVMRRRYSLGGALTPLRSVIETRGGVVFVDLGALGSSFRGVHFLYYLLTPMDLATAALASAANIGSRVYGGAVLILAGEISFVNCHFRNLIIMSPLADNIELGDLVLMVGGVASFTSCSFSIVSLFTEVAAAGLSISVMGGTAVFTWCTFNVALGVVAASGTGFSIFVGGGVLIATGCTLNNVFGALTTFGFGNVLVMAGVLILTGFSIDTSFGVLSAYGAGFYFAVGAGVFVQSGFALAQAVGVSYGALKGAVTFIGAGTAIVTGAGIALSAGCSSYTGYGRELYNGAGYASIVGSTTASIDGTAFLSTFGGRWSVPAGHIDFIGNPAVGVAGLSFTGGYGAVGFVGAGSAVLGYSPFSITSGLAGFTPQVTPYWVEGKFLAFGFGPPEYLGKRSLEKKGQESTTNTTTTTAAWSTTTLHAFGMSPGAISSLPWVPAEIKQAAASIQSASEARTGSSESATSMPGPAFVINTDLEECTVCGSGDVDGDGSGSCTVSETCDDDNDDKSTTTKYTDHHILFGSVTMEGGASPAPDALTVRDALQDLVFANRSHTGVQVSVWKDLGAPFVDHVPTTFEGSTTYQVAFIATSEDDADIITDGMKDGEDGSQPILAQALEAYFKDQQGVDVGEVTASCCKDTHVPSYTSPDFTRNSSSPLLSKDATPSSVIYIVEENHEDIPVSNVARLHTYFIRLSGFPVSTKMKVTLVGASSLSNWLPTTTDLGSPTTDGQGAAEVVWKVSALQPTDRYYVRAEVADGGQFGMTPAFQVVQKPLRRKLGSLMREVPV